MTVRELITALKKMNPDAFVGYVWDGYDRSNAEIVWLAKSGRVLIGDYGGHIHGNEDRPEGAPTDEQEPHFNFHAPAPR